MAYWGLIVFLTFEFLNPSVFFPVLAEFRAQYVIAWAVLIIALLKGKKPATTIHTWLFFLVVLLAILAIFNSPFSDVMSRKRSFEYFLIYIKCISFYLLVTMVVDSEIQLTKLINIILMLAFFVGLASIIAYQAGIKPLSGSEGSFIERRLTSYFGGLGGQSNEFAAIMLLLMPIPFCLLRANNNLIRKIFLFVASLIQLTCILLTGSRGAIVALFVSVIYLMWEYRKKVRYILVFSVIVFIASYQISSEIWERYTVLKTPGKAIEARTAKSRIREIKYSIELIKSYPLTGVGLGHYRSGKVNVLGFDRKSREADLVTHNTYLLIGVEMGMPAMILYILITLLCVKDFIITTKAWSEQKESYGFYLMVKGMKIGFLGFLVAILFLPENYNLFFYLWIALGAILRKIFKSNNDIYQKAD